MTVRRRVTGASEAAPSHRPPDRRACAPAARQQAQDLEVAAGEPVDGVVGRGGGPQRQLLGDLALDVAAVPGAAADPLDQFLRRGPLAQVARGAGPQPLPRAPEGAPSRTGMRRGRERLRTVIAPATARIASTIAPPRTPPTRRDRVARYNKRHNQLDYSIMG